MSLFGSAPHVMNPATRNRRLQIKALLSLSLFFFALPCIAFSQTLIEGPAPAQAPEISPDTEVELWHAAERALRAGNRNHAGELFARFHRLHGEAANAEEALWQACRLQHELALDKKNADWEHVRDLYRRFVTDYPDSDRYEEAYLGLGLAHFHMNFYREALIYLNLFLKRFPESDLLPEAKYWQGRTLVEVGRPAEAEKKYQELVAESDHRFRTRAVEALGDLYFATDRFHDALARYQSLSKDITSYTPAHFELIRKIGLTQARLGHETASRDHLYRYLNVMEESPHQAAVLFELGESYWRQGNRESARMLYDRALAKADPRGRPAVLSLFRLALYRSLQAKDLPPWQRKEDDLTADGDGPFQAVLDFYVREPIAQDARFALLQRFMGRSELDRAFLLAKNYLTHAAAGDGHQQEVEDILGQLLAARVEKLLAEGEHRQVVALFQDESRHMLAYGQGRLLYLVGQSLETLALYEQAEAVYFLAMSRELSAAEKADLYFRRSKVYLAREDLSSAERLLAHLRDIYQGRQEAAEIFHLSGRLREAQGRIEEALSFQEQSCRMLEPEKKSAACESQVKLLLQQGQLQNAGGALTTYRQQGWLDAGAMQDLYAELGEAWRRQGSLEKAAAAFSLAIGENMPPDSKQAQRLHLHLGDISLQLGQIRQAEIHFEQALAGPDDLLRKSAEQGYRQAGIDQSLADLQRSFVIGNGPDNR